MSVAWLRTHPPARSQYRSPRRQQVSGVIVVHDAENTPDYVAFDGGAEAVANFIRNRDTPGSYHELVDSDSAIKLVSYDDEAYQDGTGSNPHALSVSVATRHDVWPLVPPKWRTGAIHQMAMACVRFDAHVFARRGFHIPARRITRAESERGVPGFISHAERDPDRRKDPGKDFPWTMLLEQYARLRGGGTVITTPPVQEDIDMYMVQLKGSPAHALCGAGYWHNLSQSEIDTAKRNGIKVVRQVDRAEWDRTKAIHLEGNVAGPAGAHDVFRMYAADADQDTPLHLIVQGAVAAALAAHKAQG